MGSKKWILLALAPLVLAGCGNIEIPESIPSPTDTESTITDPNSLLNSISPSPSSEENNSCVALQEERDNLSEAITISQEELKSCKAEKSQLESLSQSVQFSNTQMAQLTPFLKKYLVETPQEEYKFDSCGALGIATSKSWYPQFQTLLEASKIPFSSLSRSLQPTDFYSVCISEEGQVALFLGASSSGATEFHMVKYDFGVNTISEAVLIGGSCEACPTSFDKRFGPYIKLKGRSGNTTREYNYYYDSNLIDPQ